MRRWRSRSVGEPEAIGAELAKELLPDRCLLLFADLGAGKTALTRGVAAGLGIAPEEIQSPTFTLLREHRAGSTELLHLDLYRLTASEVESAGFEERLLSPGVKVVEWAERLPFAVPGALALGIRRLGEGDREIVELGVSEPET